MKVESFKFNCTIQWYSRLIDWARERVTVHGSHPEREVLMHCEWIADPGDWALVVGLVSTEKVAFELKNGDYDFFFRVPEKESG